MTNSRIFLKFAGCNWVRFSCAGLARDTLGNLGGWHVPESANGVADIELGSHFEETDASRPASPELPEIRGYDIRANFVWTDRRATLATPSGLSGLVKQKEG